MENVIAYDQEPSSSGLPAAAGNSRRWKWSVNVILIGTSQSGKSLLINRFRSLAVGPTPLPSPSKVGSGTFSCTTDPFTYEFDIPMTDFIMVDSLKTTEVEVPEDEKSLFDMGFWKRKDLRVFRRNPVADIVRVRLLDTPGLDDDNPAKNVANIQGVLQYLNKLANADSLDHRHISAVMFVIKNTAAFTDSLQKWYLYYERCMPNLFGSIAVINTNFKLKDRKAEYAKKALQIVSLGSAKLSSHDSKMKARREAWAETFHRDPAHFFIDSKPNLKMAFEDYTSTNTVYEILLYMRSQGKLPIENIHLVKFGEMSSVDAKLVGYLYDIRAVWEEERDFHLQSMSTVHQSLARHDKNRLMWENELEELNKKLFEWDSDVQFDLNSYPVSAAVGMLAKAWKFVTFSGHENTLTITEKVYPFEVKAPNTDELTWISKTKPNAETMTWKGKYKSKWRKVPQFCVRSYTTNKTHYAKEIMVAEARKDVLIADISETKEIIQRESEIITKSGNWADENPRVAQLTKWLSLSEKYAKQLREEEVPLVEGFKQSAMKRYAKAIDKVDIFDLIEFIEEVEPEMKPAVEVALDQLKIKVK